MEVATNIQLSSIQEATLRLKHVVSQTGLEYNRYLSEKYEAEVWLKREDQQITRSYKLRGAYNKLSQATGNQTVVAASAGNHAQGVAYACRSLDRKGVIFMPQTTPNQKIEQVQFFGGEHIQIELVGDTFDDAYAAAKRFCASQDAFFIPPFDDLDIIYGQGTVGLEILEQTQASIDYVLVPIGGGGLAAGLSTVFKTLSPHTKIIGLEPSGAPAMQTAFLQGKPVTLNNIDPFVDGAAVRRIGEITLPICKENLDSITLVDEGSICSAILDLYNKCAIVAEPAGAMSIASLENVKHKIKGKTVVCIVSGGNNDISRTPEIQERALIAEGLKHYFMVKFPQRAGALKDFVLKVLGPDDDITLFQYQKKTSREAGPALIGIQLKHAQDLDPLKQRMTSLHFQYEYMNGKDQLFEFLV